MSGGVSPSAYTVSCPWPPVGETDATVRETSANEKPHFVKICRSVKRARRFAHGVCWLGRSSRLAQGEVRGVKDDSATAARQKSRALCSSA